MKTSSQINSTSNFKRNNFKKILKYLNEENLEIHFEHLCFKDEKNFDECCFFLRNWTAIYDYKYIEHRDFLRIEFAESVWYNLLIDLEYCPLVTFEYEISSEYF